MPIKIVKFYTRQEIQDNQAVSYIFGDNYARIGYGGQAMAARGEPNAIGVRTKLAPTHDEEDFMTDETYFRNIQDILHDFTPAVYFLENGETVVWPQDGIGTGLANLQKNAPETLKFIQNFVESLKTIYGVVDESVNAN